MSMESSVKLQNDYLNKKLFLDTISSVSVDQNQILHTSDKPITTHFHIYDETDNTDEDDISQITLKSVYIQKSSDTQLNISPSQLNSIPISLKRNNDCSPTSKSNESFEFDFTNLEKSPKV